MTHAWERPIRWGILGTGRIAGSFVEGLRVLPDAHVSAVGSRSAAAADAFAARYEIPRRHASYAALAADDEVDVVYVATPHPVHHAATLLCLRSGKPVLCEKPFAINATEAQEMISTAQDAGLFLMEAMWTRFAPPVVALRQRIADGDLGEVQMVSADLGWQFVPDPAHRLYDPRLGGGALLDLGVYPVSFASMLLGAPRALTALATFTDTGVDAQTGMVFDYDGGAVALLSCSMRADLPLLAVVAGSQARAELRNFHNPSALTLYRDGQPQTLEFSRTGNGMEFEAAEVHRALRAGERESPVMPLAESLAVMETLDRVRARIGLRYPGEAQPAGG